MANDPIKGAYETRSPSQGSTARPRPELEEHFQSGQGGSQTGNQTKDDLKQRGKQAANRMSAAVDEAGEKMKQQTGEASRRLKEQGRTVVSQQKDRVAEEIGHFGAAAHEAANKLDQEEDHNVAHYLHAVADQLDGVARYIRDSDTSRLVDDLSHVARRRPEIFFGGMFVAGMALTRFLKASGRPRSGRPRHGDFEAYSDEDRAFEPEYAGAATGSLHEGRTGALSGDIAGSTAGAPGLDTGDVPRATPGAPPTTGPGVSGATPGEPEKKHGDKLGSDKGPSCPPGTAGQEVL